MAALVKPKDWGPKFQGSRHCWPGLLSKNKPGWQEGLRNVSETVGSFHFQISDVSNSGYEDWDKVAATAMFYALALRTGKLTIGQVEAIYFVLPDGTIVLFLMGHSNGDFAIASIAEAVKPYGVKVYIMAFDQTLKKCPPLGANVIEAVDIHAQLTELQAGPDFAGLLHRYDFSHRGHIAVIGDEKAQAIAIRHLNKWTGQ